MEDVSSCLVAIADAGNICIKGKSGLTFYYQGAVLVG
jgi:hypothetical protein